MKKGVITGKLDLTKVSFLRPYDSTKFGFILVKIYSDVQLKTKPVVKLYCEWIVEEVVFESVCILVPIPYKRGQTVLNQIGDLSITLPGDTDQWSVYYIGFIPIGCKPVKIDIIGLNKSNYSSIFVLNNTQIGDGVYFTTLQDPFFTFSVKENCPIPNPFYRDNPAPKCYDPCISKSIPVPTPLMRSSAITYKNSSEPGQLDIYLLDKQTSQELNFAGEEITESCLRTYLLSPNYVPTKVFPNNTKSFSYGIIEIKLPFVFSTSYPCQNNPNYEMYYFSVSSMILRTDTRPPDLTKYWTINYRMLLNYVSSDGKAYVFFAPRQYLPKDEPMVIQVGERIGYVLGTPQVLYFRIKQPNSSFLKYLLSLPCYDTPETNQPIPQNDIPWINIYGDDFENFDNFLNTDHIGGFQVGRKECGKR